jgi:hypothetical protein
MASFGDVAKGFLGVETSGAAKQRRATRAYQKTQAKEALRLAREQLRTFRTEEKPLAEIELGERLAATGQMGSTAEKLQRELFRAGAARTEYGLERGEKVAQLGLRAVAAAAKAQSEQVKLGNILGPVNRGIQVAAAIGSMGAGAGEGAITGLGRILGLVTDPADTYTLQTGPYTMEGLSYEEYRQQRDAFYRSGLPEPLNVYQTRTKMGQTMVRPVETLYSYSRPTEMGVPTVPQNIFTSPSSKTPIIQALGQSGPRGLFAAGPSPIPF